MSRKWLRQCPLLVAAICFLGMGSTVIGQEEATGAGDQPPAKKAPADSPDTEKKAAPAATDKAAAKKPAADEQPAPAKAAPAKTEPAPKDDSAKAEPKKAEPKKSDPPKPAATPAPEVAGDVAKTAQATFGAKLAEWKNILKSLRTLTSRYSIAKKEEVSGIEQEWDDLIAQGESLIPQLRTAGKAAFAAGQGGDRTVERFLTKLLLDDIEHDRFEQAADLSISMIESGCEVSEIFDAAGVAAFNTNDYGQAETLLKRALDAGSLSEQGQHSLSLIADYAANWEKEKAIREKEAAADDLPRVKISTSCGDMVVELFENEAPGTVGNFISLVESKKFYDGLSFHRVLPGFMAQGGCPRGDGSGGPGYMIKCETDAPNQRLHFRGSLSMAHAGKDTGGSQFFLTFVPTESLNRKHTVFGRVIEGMDVLGKIQRIDPEKPDAAVKAETIIKMEVIRKRDHEYKPVKSQ